MDVSIPLWLNKGELCLACPHNLVKPFRHAGSFVWWNCDVRWRYRFGYYRFDCYSCYQHAFLQLPVHFVTC